MRKKEIIFLAAIIWCGPVWAQDGIGIGTTSVDECAVLEIQSTSKGLLLPRMSSDNVITPRTSGLVIYETGDNSLYLWNGSWRRVQSSPSGHDFDMNANRIFNLADGTATGDAVNRAQLNGKLSLGGGTMSGNLDMGGNRINNLSEGTAAGDAVNKAQLDAATKTAWGIIGGGSGWQSSQRTITLDLGSSESRTLNLVGWSDINKPGSSAWIQLNLSGRNSTLDSYSLIVQRNFRPGVEGSVSQENVFFTLITSYRYIRLKATPNDGATINYYGIQATLVP